MTRAVHHPGLAALFLNDSDEAWAELQRVPPGHFDIHTKANGQRQFWFVCPGTCKSLAPIAIRPVVDGSPQSWDWDGNLDAPTLSPSINHVGCWHGWLKAGEFAL